MIAEKGLACEERDVSLPQSEHKEPWFMRLNLGEEVPVIIHRDNIISDYDQIIDYVERTFTGGTAAPANGPRAHTGPGTSGNLGRPTGAWAGPRVPQKEPRGGSDAPRNHRATGMATDPQGPHGPSPQYSRERAWASHPLGALWVQPLPRSSGVTGRTTDPFEPLTHERDPDPL